MSLSFGRDLYLTPGPSVMPDSVLAAMMRAAPSIYDGPIVDLTESIVTDLKTIAGTRHQLAMYIANGHGAWEAALENVFAPGEKALVVHTGNFAQSWANVAERMGIEVSYLHFGTESAADAAVLAETLRADATHGIKAVFCTQTDTASSASNDIPALRAALDAAGHPALLMVDCVASFACERFEMDAWGVDVMLTASQKGLMCPPGIAYVFYNEKAEARARPKPDRAPYWDWTDRANPGLYYQYFFGTTPTHLLYAQREALNLLLAEGMENVFRRHEIFAQAVWAAVEAWGTAGPLRLNVANRAHRSRAVTAVRAKGVDCFALQKWLRHKTGLTLGKPIGFDTPEFGNGAHAFRIGHMGHMNPPMLLGGLSSLQAGLIACGIAHGAGGVDAAVQVIAANA